MASLFPHPLLSLARPTTRWIAQWGTVNGRRINLEELATSIATRRPDQEIADRDVHKVWVGSAVDEDGEIKIDSIKVWSDQSVLKETTEKVKKELRSRL